MACLEMKRKSLGNILGSGAMMLTIFSYVNFAFGDEPNPVVYGGSTARLQTLKKKYDPTNVFNQWFDITS